MVGVATATARDDRPSKPLSVMMYELAKQFVGRDDPLAAELIVAADRQHREEQERAGGR